MPYEVYDIPSISARLCTISVIRAVLPVIIDLCRGLQSIAKSGRSAGGRWSELYPHGRGFLVISFAGTPTSLLNSKEVTASIGGGRPGAIVITGGIVRTRRSRTPRSIAVRVPTRLGEHLRSVYLESAEKVSSTMHGGWPGTKIGHTHAEACESCRCVARWWRLAVPTCGGPGALFCKRDSKAVPRFPASGGANSCERTG